jgi:predicted transcriptional regulator
MPELDATPTAGADERDEREALRRAVAEAREAAERGELVDHEIMAAWLDDLARGIGRPAPKPR